MKVYKILEMDFFLPDSFEGDPDEALVEFCKYVLENSKKEIHSYDRNNYEKYKTDIQNGKDDRRVIVAHKLLMSDESKA